MPLSVTHASAEQNQLLGEILRRVAEGEVIEDLEMTRKTRDGRLIEVALSVSPVRDACGGVVGAAAAGGDITDRKRAQETVGMLAKMLASSREAINLITLEGVISFWSAGSEAMYGYSHAQALGRDVSMLMASPGQQAGLEGMLTRITAGGSVDDLETTHLTNDGRVIDVSLSAWPVHDGDGRVVGAAMIARKITERKQATAALSEAQDRFRYAFEESPVGMVMLDLEFRFTQANEEFCRIAGYTREQLLGASFATITHPDDIERNREGMLATLNGSQSVYRVEKRYIHASGDTVHVTLHAALLRSPDGAPLSFLGHAQDITDRKRATHSSWSISPTTTR